jgi:hypothetical protein
VEVFDPASTRTDIGHSSETLLTRIVTHRREIIWFSRETFPELSHSREKITRNESLKFKGVHGFIYTGILFSVPLFSVGVKDLHTLQSTHACLNSKNYPG